MKNFCSSLDIRDILKVAFFGKKWQISFQGRIVPLLYLVINICNDRLSQQSFLVALSNSSREKYINTTERHAQGASTVCNKNFTGRSQLNTAGQCQIYWEADPQHSAENCGAVPQDWQLYKAWTNYHCLIFFSKNATFELSLMSNDENKFQTIFQIQRIKNA